MQIRSRTIHTLNLDADERFTLKFKRGNGFAEGEVRAVEFTVKVDEPGNTLVYLEGDTTTKAGKPGRKFRHWTGPSYRGEIFEQIPEAVREAMRTHGYAK